MALDDEQIVLIRLPNDGSVFSTHRNGTDHLRVVEAEPAEEAHVYDIHPDGIFNVPVQLIPALMQTQQIQDTYVGSCKYVIGSHCGRLFDQCFQQVIKEPTAYSANGPQEIDAPKL
ncbi:unnamed protein product [Cylindrotheca closterium]|uniref:Uncharacterized protein n=1 Tax=Cylindrotheca closterium TaxID=2856 RepID=A0AAD2FGU6_9STRA|nr:unnamed protein product [Cylindrotheca closterium]